MNALTATMRSAYSHGDDKSLCIFCCVFGFCSKNVAIMPICDKNTTQTIIMAVMASTTLSLSMEPNTRENEAFS